MGFEEAEIEAVEGDYLNCALYSDEEKAAMRWAEVLTDKLYQGGPGQKPQGDAAMVELKKHFNEAQIVEITMVSGFFNFWNRFTDGLAIDVEESPVMGKFKKSTAIDPQAYVDYMRECWWNDPLPGEKDAAE